MAEDVKVETTVCKWSLSSYQLQSGISQSGLGCAPGLFAGRAADPASPSVAYKQNSICAFFLPSRISPSASTRTLAYRPTSLTHLQRLHVAFGIERRPASGSVCLGCQRVGGGSASSPHRRPCLHERSRVSLRPFGTARWSLCARTGSRSATPFAEPSRLTRLGRSTLKTRTARPPPGEFCTCRAAHTLADLA